MLFHKFFRLLALIVTLLLFQSCTSYRLTGPYHSKTIIGQLSDLKFNINSIRYTQGVSHNHSPSGLLKKHVYNDVQLKREAQKRYPNLFTDDGIPIDIDITASRRAPFNFLAFLGYMGTLSLIPYSEEEKVTCNIDVKLAGENLTSSGEFTYVHDSLLSVYFPTGALYAGTEKTGNQVGGMANANGTGISTLPEVKNFVAGQFSESLVRTILAFNKVHLQKLKYENE